VGERKPWAEKELALLRDTSLSLAKVAERTGRSEQGVANKAYRLGIARYGYDQALRIPDDIRRFVEDTSLTYAEVAARTGLGVREVEWKAKLLGVERLPDYDNWTPDELALFEDRTLQFPDIAALTGRSREAVKVKANRLGVHKRRLWSQPGYVPEGNDYRGRGWKRLRLQVLERDGYACQDGGEFFPSGAGLVVHHVIPWRLRQVNDLRFLVTLCRSHHMRRPEHAWVNVPEDILALATAPISGG
jgi:hypothetical protein